jgi:uncharacterized protein (UPF0276 family)
MTSKSKRIDDPAPLTGTELPKAAGIGLRHPHMPNFLNGDPEIAWLEVHSENYLIDGGPRLQSLLDIRTRYPISCHGVGLSLGSSDGLDADHLRRLRTLFELVRPAMISEHVSWSIADGTYLNDLLPLPYTQEALDVICDNVTHAQDTFGRRLLVENPSSYVSFPTSTMSEWDFMAEIARRTGCGTLLDVNNIHVSAINHGFDPIEYLDAIDVETVGEIHVAGHASREIGGETLLIDDHGHPVIDVVWDFLDAALARTGPYPILVDRDNDIPPLADLLDEAAQAQRALDRSAGSERRDVA